MIKKFGFLLIMLIMIMPSIVSAEDICVNGNKYNVISAGSKVDVQKIDGENIERESVLPKEYFSMKMAMGTSELTYQQIDEYLETKKNNNTFNGNNDLNFKIEAFLRQYESIYQQYSLILKNSLSDNVQEDVETEANYAFKVSQLNQKCNRSFDENGHYVILSCPTSEQYGSNGKFNTTTFQKAIGTFEFNGKGQFNVKMKDLFDGNLLIRVVKNGRNNTEEYDYGSIKASGITNGYDLIYELKSDSVTMTFNKGEDVRLEFYINPNAGVACSGAYVGYTTFSTPEYAYITNPFMNMAVCKNFKNSSTVPDSYKSIFVPECYKSELEYFTEYMGTNEQTIANKIKEKESYFVSSSTNSNDISNLQCHYQSGNNVVAESANSTKVYIYNPNNSKYWAASCTETVRVTYDRPKQVIAGAGFTYQATLEVERKCTPIAINKIQKTNKCSYKIECWGGPYNHDGDPSAGPSEDFDNCVYQCDGGTYTKNCINSCYKSVYENEEKTYSFSFLDVAKNISASKSVKQVANSSCNTKTSDSPNYCYDENADWWYKNTKVTNVSQYKSLGLTTGLGSPIYEVAANSMCNSNFKCTSFHGIVFTYSNQCNHPTNPAVCYEVYTSVPRPNCSDNPDEDYKTLETQANLEYEALIKALKVYENSEDVTMSVIDSYKTGSNGKLLKTTWDDKVKFESSTQEAKVVNNVRQEIYTNTNAYKSVPEVTVTKSYTANLPQAYLNAITGEEKYVKENYQADKDEVDGGNKYYTDLNSKKYNDFRRWYDTYAPDKENYDPSVRIGNNINVVFENIGTKQGDDNSYTWDKIDIDCFYGLYNNHHIDCGDDGVCDSDDDDDNNDDGDNVDLICEPGDVCTGGLQYMFRQVNLQDLFPDRNPRWNWTYTTQVGNSYLSNPSEIIERIEATGNDTFAHEPEYEFVITRGSIQRIRKYNDTAGSYQSYPDMTCTIGSGAIKECKSGFMSNSSYIKSFTRNTELGQNTNRNG